MSWPRPWPAPARGVIEVKAAAEELPTLTPSEQIKGYLSGYCQILLTNYRDFLAQARPRRQRPKPSKPSTSLTSRILAAAAHPRKTADALGERFEDTSSACCYLTRR